MISVQDAIKYNTACKYPGNLINVILLAVRAPVGWQWNEPGVVAVSKWQESNKLLADGMVGKKTLEKLISELTLCGKTADASSLKQFLAISKASQSAQPKQMGGVVASFPQPKLTHPFKFNRERMMDPKTRQSIAAWAARGTFEVQIKLDPHLSEDERMRYEYRQFIKGAAWVEDGVWSANRWTQTAARIDVSSLFDVPPDPVRDLRPGITSIFKEDGKYAEVPGGAHFRFGYRNGQVHKTERFMNYWSPHNVSGANLTVRDTPGYAAPLVSGIAPKVHMEFTFCGVVVEVEEVETDNDVVSRVVRQIDSKFWSYRFEDVLR